MRIAISSVTIVSLAGLLTACATEPRAPGPDQLEVEFYLETAEHLDDKQMEAMMSGRHFCGNDC